jgi:hypothetical protein
MIARHHADEKAEPYAGYFNFTPIISVIYDGGIALPFSGGGSGAS